MDIPLHNSKEWEKLDEHLKYLYAHHNNDAVRLAMNEIAKKTRTNLVKVIAGTPLKQALNAQFASQQLPKLPPLRARSKDVRNLLYIRTMKKKNFVAGEKQSASMTGYANDIPAIRLITTNVRGGGGDKRAKGGISRAATHGKARAGSKPGTKGRKLAKARIGGIRAAGVLLDDAFINIARYNSQVHIMRRTTKKTWKPGRSGWDAHRKGKKAPRQDRMPIGVVRYDIQTPMKANMERVANATVAANAQTSYDRAMGILIAKSANKSF